MQDPGNSQAYNKYAYCLNNPLRYTDPSGYTWLSDAWDWAKGKAKGVGHWLGNVGSTLLNTGGRAAAWAITLPASSIDAFWNWDASRLDPCYSGTISNNGFKITTGLFRGAPDQIISRFTWELPQTILGYGASMVSNYIGDVRSVSFYNGATVVEHYTEGWGGITLGSFINGQRGITADPNNWLFQHEYGHYMQSYTSGIFYLSKYGIPSLLSKGDHNMHPVEQDANVRAYEFFHKHTPNYNGWRFYANPIKGYDETKPYDDPSNQEALKNGRLNLSWYDYLMTPFNLTFIGDNIPGLINTLILNKNQ